MIRDPVQAQTTDLETDLSMPAWGQTHLATNLFLRTFPPLKSWQLQPLMPAVPVADPT